MTGTAELGPFVGILGGMGPAATVDLMQKIVDESGALRDQDHVPVVAHNVGQIPDRQAFLLGAGESPLPALYAGLARLNLLGAGVILIPCNTAHIWYDTLTAHSQAPILHIADACVAMLAERAPASATRIGIIGTQATIAAGFYQRRLAQLGFDAVVNTGEEFARWFTPGCYAVKGGRLAEGGELFERAATCLTDRGAEHLVLACTEIPIGLAASRSSLLPQTVDAASALARAAVAWWREACAAREVSQ